MLYILVFFIIAFSKELIVINAEFVVIVGFLTIFFVLKSLLQKPIVESLEAYSHKIRNHYLVTLNTDIFALDNSISSIEDKVQIRTDLENYSILLENLILDYFDAIKKNFEFTTNVENIQELLKTFSHVTMLQNRNAKFTTSNKS
jgi:hypothetical protein